MAADSGPDAAFIRYTLLTQGCQWGVVKSDRIMNNPVFSFLALALLTLALPAGSIRETSVSKETSMNTPLSSALPASGPSPDIAESDRIYDWLIGSWDAQVVDHFPDGTRQEGTGEWHFGWVLEGRAIQDVWISPPRQERDGRSSGLRRNRYGTSIRMFHPVEKRWHVTWINPVSGAHNELVARRDAARIVQEGRDPDGSVIRWVFADISPRSARWYGERSKDGGKTWQLEAEFSLRRRDFSGQ